MQLQTAFQKLGRNDTRLIRRDSFMVFMVAYIIILAAAVRFIMPWAADQVMVNFDFDLTPYYPLFVGFTALVAVPLMVGIIFGFLLLDERDTDTLTAMLVTPLPLDTFVLYRIAVTTAISFVTIIAAILIMNLVAVPPLALVLIAAVGALYGPVVMLFFANFSNNKVEGFATAKIISTFGLIVFGAWFLPEPWQFLTGIIPIYWPNKALWVAVEGGNSWPIHLVLGAVGYAIVLIWFVRRFRSVAYK